MTARLGMAWVLVAVASLALVVTTFARYRRTAASVGDSDAATSLQSRQLGDARELLASLPPWAKTSTRSADEPALAQTFAGAMAAAGMPPTAVESLTPSRVAVVETSPGVKIGPQIERGRAAAALTGVTLPQLGRLLLAWHEAAPDWIVTQIDLAPQRLTPVEAERYAGSDLPLRVSLTVERLTASGLESLMPVTAANGHPALKDSP